MEAQAGERLIEDLLADPRTFNDRGRAYDLLQAYFGGLSVLTLGPLLTSEDRLVQRAAVFVAAELGRAARGVVDDVIPLLGSQDRYLQYHAMEILAVCCEAEHAAKFAHVALQLESGDDVLRALAMRLLSRADPSQLEEASRFLAEDDSIGRAHPESLRLLAADPRIEAGSVLAMIGDPDPLLRRYGAIAAQRLSMTAPSLMNAVGASSDGDLRRFDEVTRRDEAKGP